MVTREDVENIAMLSKLFVPEEELDGLTKSMQEIVDFADTINNAPASDEGFDNINNLSNVFREDEVAVVPQHGNPQKRSRAGRGSLPRAQQRVRRCNYGFYC